MSLTLKLLCQASLSLWRDSRNPEVLLTWNMSGSSDYGSRWVLFLLHVFQAQILFKRQLTISSLMDSSHLPSNTLIFLLASFLSLGLFEFTTCQVLKLLSYFVELKELFLYGCCLWGNWKSILPACLCIRSLLYSVPSAAKCTD